MGPNQGTVISGSGMGAFSRTVRQYRPLMSLRTERRLTGITARQQRRRRSARVRAAKKLAAVAVAAKNMATAFKATANAVTALGKVLQNA